MLDNRGICLHADGMQSPSTGQLIVAVTGASGFVGRAVVEALRTAPGVTGRALYRSTPDHVIQGVEQMMVGDLVDPTAWAPALQDVDVVIHTAARTHVLRDRATDPYSAYRRTNVEGTLNLGRAAIAAGVRRIVFLSSIKVNGERTRIDRPFTEQTPPAPEDAYGRTKLEAELGLADLARDAALEVAIVRSPLIYGPGAKGNLARLMKLIERGWPLPLGAVQNRRSLIAIESLVSALLALGTHPNAAGKTFLISDQADISTADLVVALAEGLGRRANLWPVPVAWLEAAGGLLGRTETLQRLLGSLCVDSSRLTREIGWTPSVQTRAGLIAMARHYAEAK